MVFAIAIHILLAKIAHILVVLILVLETENVFPENASVMKTIKVRIVLIMFVIAIIVENVCLINNVFVIKDSMEKIVKKVYAKITAMLMELVIKENAFVKQDGEQKIVQLNYVLMIGTNLHYLIVFSYFILSV